MVIGSDEFRFLQPTFSNGLYWTGVSPVLEFIKHDFPLVCISILFLPNGAGRFQHNSAGIQQAYMVDCFPCGWPPHSLDFNPTETLWERTLSHHLFRMLAIMLWSSRQKCMFWHCIRLLKRCHFARQKNVFKVNGRAGWGWWLREKEHAAAPPILGSDAGGNVCLFECSGVCWLTVQIRWPYKATGYLSHSYLMVSSCNMCPEPKMAGKHCIWKQAGVGREQYRWIGLFVGPQSGKKSHEC